MITKTKEEQLKQIEEKWNNATLADSFIFYHIMTKYPDVCKHVIEILLNKKIDHIEYPDGETTFGVSPLSKGIRLDVYVKSEDEIYDVEMQVNNPKNLIKRSRYYLSIMDVDNLLKGKNYTTLRDSYSLFICMFDPFKKGFPIYPFQNYCTLDKNLALEDGRHTIFFNAKKYDTMDTEERKNFFEFLNGLKAKDSFEIKLENLVHEAKQRPDWRKKYMTWEMEMQDRFDQGLKLGIEQGIEQGAKQTSISNAKKLLKEDVDAETIARCVDLSLEKVLELKQDMVQSTKTSNITTGGKST